MKKIFIVFLLSSFIFSCSPTPSPSQIVDVYASPAAAPFLDELYACADSSSVTLNLTSDSPDLSLHLGLPDGWAGSAFQVAAEDILIVASLQSPLPSLSMDQMRTIFTGQNPSVQVWAYASEGETQRLFESAVMDGRSVTSFARLAVSPMHMVEALTSDPNAVGLLPRRWMTDGLRELFLVANVPILALTPYEPEGIARDLIACMQE
ncbi:MAG: hypothetical protein C4583_10460 [Anaerolineaceae bacterium]|nr:MAG: hypothetical protein C4583_10460 [Anaerolineaceae bacterium]